MATLSLLEGCQEVIDRSHETWKSYFSRWEILAGLEEESPDQTFTIEKNASKKKPKGETKLLKNKRKLKGKIMGGKKVAKKNKNETAGDVVEEFKGPGNENLPEETDNKQLEMRLRTIFMDILKANKNKWGVFAVLSQAFSHGDVTIKGPHSLRSNHQLALPCNDIERNVGNLLFRKVQVFFPRTHLIQGEIRSDGVEFFGGSFSAAGIRRKETSNCTGRKFHSDAFNKFKFCTDNARQLFPKATFTPANWRIISTNPPAVGFRDEYAATRKTKSEYFRERNIPEMNIALEEKGSGSLCLHKRTNDLNMENSNFVTPERNSSKRKCFSGNISQRKRRRRTKLFFDFWDGSDSENDEQTKTSTPKIGWQSKTEKIGLAQGESDSDESDNIL